MEQDQTQKEKKDKYNLDDDTSSYSPEIEEESNNEEEIESQKKESKENLNLFNEYKESSEFKSSNPYDKLISIEKKMDQNQEKQKYSKYNQSYKDNKDNNNFNNNYFSPKKKQMKKYLNDYDDRHSNEFDINENAIDNKINKNLINLNESDNEDQNNNEDNYNNRNNNNRHRRFIQRDSNNNNNNINNMKQREENSKEKGCELFIGNLNITTEKDDLIKLFKPYGNIIDIRIHKNEESKKCYAFVRYLTKDMAKNALKLDSTMLNNRHIKVTKSNENATIFIGNIRKTWTQDELETKIRRIFHNINKIEFFPDPNNPTKNRGFCFGIFNTRNEAIKALNYVNKKGGINIDGISITCDWADVVDDDDNSKSNQIFISNIKKDVHENDLKSYFNRFANVISVIMSKNHINSKRKDLVFITFESHEDALLAIQRFEEEKKNSSKLKDLKKIFLLDDNENINMIQVSLAFSQEAMQNKKKIKDNRKKVPSNSGNSNNTGSSNNPSGGNIYNNNRSNNNNNNKNNNKTFMGNMNPNNEYKSNYPTAHRGKSYQKHDHGNNQNNLAGNKNVNDLLSSLNNNKSYGNNNYPMNYNNNNNNNNKNNQMNTNLVNQLNQLFTSSLDPNNMNKANNTTNINNYMNNNNNASNISNQNINSNINQNQLLVLSNILNLCQQNPSLLQQMNNLNNIYSPGVNSKNEIIDINSEKKFINRKRNSSNNNYTNNINNNLNPNNNFNNSSMSNDLQNNNFLNISPNQTRNQNIISQFPYIQNNSTVSSINNPNVPNISNIQNLQNIIPTIPNNPNFNNFSK